MSMKLFLHIGATKTGTSLIQSALAKNVDALRANVIAYPDFVSLEQARANQITSGNGVPMSKLLGYEPGPQITTGHLADEMRAAFDAGLSLLYSSEMMSHFAAPEAAAFGRQVAALGYELRVIIYVRAIADHALSLYHQWIKSAQVTGSLADYVRNGYAAASQRRLVDRALRGFGPGAVMVRNYDAAGDDLFGDFLTGALGLPGGHGLAMDGARINRSLTAIEAAVMREMNPVFLTPVQARFASDSMLYAAPDLAPSRTMTSEAMRAIEEVCGGDVAAINAHVDGPPITLKSHEIVVSDEPPPELSEAEKAMARIIASLIRNGQYRRFR